MSLPLQALEMALHADHADEVHALLETARITSGNDALMAAGRDYGFPTCVVETSPIRGHAIMLTKDLARVMYGHAHPGGVTQLLRAYHFTLLTIRTFTDDLKSLVREAFRLSPYDGSSTFATWQHFLVVGMYGKTEQARHVKSYLLRREEASRVSDTVEVTTGLSPRQLLTTPWDLLAQMVDAGRQHAEQIQAMQAAQQEHQVALLAQQAQLIATQQQALDAHDRAIRADTKSDMALATTTRMTVEHFILANGLLGKFPHGMHRRISDWLQEFCYTYNLDVLKHPVYGKPWSHEKAYPLAAFSAWLRHEEQRLKQPALRAISHTRNHGDGA